MVPVPLGVTVSGKASAALTEHARSRAAAWGLPFLPRRRKAPLGPMLGSAAEALLVFGEDGLTLTDAQGSLRFHMGMAELRLKHLALKDQPDHLLEATGLSTGESLLDCTLGLGQDALVAAHAVGPSGRVVGLEKSLPLYAVVSEGLERLGLGAQACRVEAVHADAAAALRALADRSFACVFFDPMFARPRRSGGSFDVLRRYADYSPLTAQMLAEARRVARRCVVVKGSPHSDDLKKLGLTPLPGRRDPRVQWARLDAR